MPVAGRAIGFIGLGKIGFPMAARLYEAGGRLTVYDLASEQTRRFATEHPGSLAAGGLGAFADAAVVLTSLPDSTAVDGVVLGTAAEAGLIDILAAGSTVIDMSSADPMRSRALARELGGRGLHFLDAPVSGGVNRALDGSLSIMVGGDAAHYDEQRDLLQQIGSTITYVGAAGAGHALKALNNYVSAAGLVATVEALLVGQEFGLDPEVMIDVLNNSTGRNYTTENKVKQFMLSGAFNSGFSLGLMTKDVRTAYELGKSLGWEMKLGRAVAGVWSEAADELPPTADHTEMHRYLRATERSLRSRTPRPRGEPA
jgi:3-hydroxyisobutyrate dehydrogenase